jgi:hypothetical protein
MRFAGERSACRVSACGGGGGAGTHHEKTYRISVLCVIYDEDTLRWLQHK